MSTQHHHCSGSRGKEQLQALFDRIRRGDTQLADADSDLFGHDKKNVNASAGIGSPEKNGEHELLVIDIDKLGKRYSGNLLSLRPPKHQSSGALGYKHIAYLQGKQTHMAMIADNDTLVLGTYNDEIPTSLYLGA
ncbi:unnamed protein product [Rhizoctonia solani]|uniref:Uncharacterized protein n=1 Tax=Rhizoctonia solani TaxID=456999 RepID=A0A8H3A911_9AGAM|nr:unnamed protein product [Rhizoctonia solani]